MKIALVLTAAGSGKRFGSDKLAYPIDGKPMLLHALELYDRMRDRFVSRTVVLKTGAEERRKPCAQLLRFGCGASRINHGSFPFGFSEHYSTPKQELQLQFAICCVKINLIQTKRIRC